MPQFKKIEGAPQANFVELLLYIVSMIASLDWGLHNCVKFMSHSRKKQVNWHPS